MYKYADSVIATTNLDLQGERFTFEQLQKLVEEQPHKIPLNVEHDLGKPPIGYITNLRLEKSGEIIRVIADIYTEEPISSNGGLSLSATSLIHNPPDSVLTIYLPFPAYNDTQLVRLLEESNEIAIGRLQKKGMPGAALGFLTIETVGLIVTATVLLIGPEWQIQYERHVRPQIIKALQYINEKLKPKGIDADLSSKFKTLDGTVVELLLIPDRTTKISGQDEVSIDRAVHEAVSFASSHERKDIRKIRAVYYPNRKKYEIITIEYVNGEHLHIAP